MEQEQVSNRLITFGSVHIEVLGPTELGNSRVTNVCVADFLRAVEHDVRDLLRQRIELFADLKTFKLRFDGRRNLET
jgi:hypothetical protein